MFRSTLALVTVTMLGFAAHAMPAQLAEVDAYARTVVIRKFIELSAATAPNVYYTNFESSVGKYSSDWGDFHFSADIWISNYRKFHCENEFIRAGFDRQSGVMTVDQEDLESRSECKEVEAIQ